MAEKEKKDEELVTLLNRGKRHYDFAPDRRLSPNETMTMSVAEAERLLSMYGGELVDISKLPGQKSSAEAEALKKSNADLVAENVALKAQLAEKGEGESEEKKKKK